MKINYFLLMSFYFVFGSVFCFSQECKSSKYGLVFMYPSGVKKSEKEQLLDYVSLLRFYHNGKVPLCTNENDTVGGVKCSDFNDLPDSTINYYTLIKIIEWPKPYAHKIINKRTKRIKVYRLRFVDDKETYYDVFSIDNKTESRTKLIIGEKYKLLLLSYFGKDIKPMVEGKYVFLLIDDVWISQVYMDNINIYTSPCINDLYYIPLEKAKHK